MNWRNLLAIIKQETRLLYGHLLHLEQCTDSHNNFIKITVNALLTHTFWILFLCTKPLVDYSCTCMQGQDTPNKQTLWKSWFRVCSSGISYSKHNRNLQTYKKVRYVQQKTVASLLAKNMINMLNKHLQTQT